MLTELLHALKDGKTHSLQELAAMLKTDIPVIKAQLEYLERQGYIKKVALNPGCSKSCQGCQGCSPNVPAPVVWELTSAAAEYLTVTPYAVPYSYCTAGES